MSSQRRHRRRSRSPESRSTSRSYTRTSTTQRDDDVHGAGGGHRMLKRSSASLPVRWRSPATHHSWVLLNRAGAWRDDFPGDCTTSAMSFTSKGDEISVSFELVEPPRISVLTVDCSSAATVTPREPSGNVIAAHRDVVLLAITYGENTSRPDSVVDLFVYQPARRNPSRRGRLPVPSLLLLPSAGGAEMYWDTEGMGIMSCTSSSGDDDDHSPSFVVAYAYFVDRKTNDVRLFRSGTGQWESFNDLHVHGANGGRDLFYWTTDTVLTYGSRYMIWVDYYRGMVLMDLMYSHSHSSKSETNQPSPPPPPRLQYVPLPVNRVEDPEDIDFGDRGCPKDSRCVSVTRYGIKFVSIDTQHWSNFGLGHHHVRTWKHRFRITTWWLREHNYTWRRDVTMHEQEFWDAFDGGDRRFGFPHVQPEFPIIDPDNPDVIVFRLEKPASPGRYDRDDDEPKWMIEVDLRKKVLLAATAYSKKESDGLSCDAGTINSARVSHYDPIPSELPRYC